MEKDHTKYSIVANQTLFIIIRVFVYFTYIHRIYIFFPLLTPYRSIYRFFFLVHSKFICQYMMCVCVCFPLLFIVIVIVIIIINSGIFWTEKNNNLMKILKQNSIPKIFRNILLVCPEYIFFFVIRFVYFFSLSCFF